MLGVDVLDWMKRHRYELIAALNGALVMVLEIVGARMIAPFFGSSVYVWTAVIGVILGALSVGYWYGGRLADYAPSDRYLALVLVAGAGVLLAALLTSGATLSFVAGAAIDIRLQALVAAAILFAPANVLMGMVAPYLAKLKLKDLSEAGASIGGLYAAGTVGSIAGTFAAGYWLIAWLGNRSLGIWIVLGLLAASVMAARRHYWGWRALVAAVALSALLTPSGWWVNERVVYDGDSAYSRLMVVDTEATRPERLLVTDNSAAESGVYLDNLNEPLFGYIKSFLRAADAVKPKRVLLIGGGTYTLPRLILDRFPDAQIDVVEIDPKMDELAERFFGYRTDARVRIIHADGRVFLNSNRAEYDVVYMDAFSSTTPPFQLTTVEAVRRLAVATGRKGIVVVNLVSARAGEDAALGWAEMATYREVFDLVRMGPVDANVPERAFQNHILVAGHPGSGALAVAKALQLNVSDSSARILTDDFAPVEQMTAQ